VGLKPNWGDLLGAEDPRGLNRTSVGLKPGPLPRWVPPQNRPQSNQRGIETGDLLGPPEGLPGPQSNQRGIETPFLLLKNISLEHASIEPAWD